LVAWAVQGRMPIGDGHLLNYRTRGFLKIYFKKAHTVHVHGDKILINEKQLIL